MLFASAAKRRRPRWKARQRSGRSRFKAEAKNTEINAPNGGRSGGPRARRTGLDPTLHACQLITPNLQLITPNLPLITPKNQINWNLPKKETLIIRLTTCVRLITPSFSPDTLVFFVTCTAAIFSPSFTFHYFKNFAKRRVAHSPSSLPLTGIEPRWTIRYPPPSLFTQPLD